jgi:hypothetical protein
MVEGGLGSPQPVQVMAGGASRLSGGNDGNGSHADKYEVHHVETGL